MNNLSDLFKEKYQEIASMKKNDRIIRLIELSVKQEFNTATIEELTEIGIIQTIRFKNGEIAEVLASRESDEEDFRWKLIKD